MCAENIIESLDSNWFFFNIFSSPTQSSTFTSDRNTTQPHINDNDSPKSKRSKPKTSILHHSLVQSQDATTQVQTSSKHSDLVAEAKLQTVTQANERGIQLREEERSKRDKRSEKSSTKRRGKSYGQHECGQGKGLNDLGFHLMAVGSDDNPALIAPGLWTMGRPREYQTFGCPSLIRMPPFNDGMAMKEHLKSWAYAVACSVK